MAAKDTFDNSSTTKISPGEDIFPITPDDDNDLELVTRGFCFTAEGTLRVTTLEGNVRDLPSGLFCAGVIHSMRITRVHSTGTTATDIHGVV